MLLIMKKYLILITLTSFLIFSCNNKGQIKEDNNYSSVFDNTDTDKMTLSSISISNKLTQIDLLNELNSQIKIDGKLILNPNKGKNFKKINNTNIDNLSSVYGKDVSISFDDSQQNKIDNVTMYNPELINFENADELMHIRNDSGLTIHWNKDNNNSNPIVIVLIDRGDGVNLNTMKNINLKKIVPDNGVYTISRSEMLKFSNNHLLDITISRGNQKVVNGKSFTLHNSNFLMAKINN